MVLTAFAKQKGGFDLDNKERERLVEFCFEATAQLNGVGVSRIDRDEFLVMTDQQLKKEADWLDDMLGK
jgi:hypothetical protein